MSPFPSSAPPAVRPPGQGLPVAERVRGDVQAALSGFLDRKLSTAPDPCLRPLVDVVRDFTAGGKRLRPLFCYFGWTAAGGDPDSAAIRQAGAALELFHAFALIHDDIMDASDRRRGRPTVHRTLAARFDGRPAPGAAQRFGRNAAILLGDLCMVWSDELLHAVAAGLDQVCAARPLIDSMRTELMTGQYLDLRHESALDRTDQLWQIIRYKTATYTVERPLQIGAALAGADEALLRAFTDYGQPLGEAFQLRDDLLGVFGNPGVTGKSVLDDLRAGKRTVLMAVTYRRASQKQRAVIRALYGDPDLGNEGADQLRQIIRATGAAAAVEQMIVERRARALTTLNHTSMSLSVRQVLADLATDATRRSI